MKVAAPLTVVYRPVGELVPYARNARTHSDEQVAQIAASIREFGWTNPILLDEQDGIVAGHGRLRAAHLLEMGEVPTIVVAGLTEAQKRALVLADNKLALNAGWDFAILRDELADLDTGDFDMSVIGFSDAEMEQIATWAPDGVTAGLTDADAAPPAPVKPVSDYGDIWQLGAHRIRCGDSTSAKDVAALLAGAKPNLMVTDPPYGVEYDPKWRADRGVNKNKAKMGAVLNDDRADWGDAWSLFPGDVAYVWHGMLHAGSVFQSLVDAEFVIRAEIVWAKDRLVMSRGHYHPQHESCWYAVREKATANWSGDHKQATVWQINAREDSGHGHSTQKPVECMRRPIENNSNPGQAVYDPFCGSGTTIIAAEQTGRACYAMELSTAYVDVCVKRWQEFTGKQATLENDGRTFAEIASERLREKKAA